MATVTEQHCLTCHKPIRVKDNRRRVKRYCSDRCRMAGFRRHKYNLKVKQEVTDG